MQCEQCHKRPKAVNYYRKGKTYYRKYCDSCLKKYQESRKKPNQLLKKSGYKKKIQCDRCGFRAKTEHQIEIYYLDGNNLNVSFGNLRSFCSNCMIEIKHMPMRSRNDLLADF